MKKILISPYSRTLRGDKSDKVNPKNFPYWAELIKLFQDNNIEVVQIGTPGEIKIEGVTDFRTGLKLSQIRDLIQECNTWISVDSFLQHLNHCYDRKRGIVIYSQSDPKIFGYIENNNLLKDVSYLRERQFWMWEQCEYNKDAFVTADVVLKAVLEIILS